MNFSDSIAACFGKYAQFDGRASRSEYWWFFLFNLLVSVFLRPTSAGLYLIFALVVFIPSFSVLVRRLHDVNRSGWNYWWVLTIVGAIPLVIWLATPGDGDENRYGPAP